ncbi:MAG: FtsX-like permease family protein [Methanoregulaceae archaeon]|nr:FtsX-like permease family protein [Methanoregulaceae archaeon]
MSSRHEFHFPGLVFRNLVNRPYRTIVFVFSFALIAATLFSSQYLMSGARESLDEGVSRLGADILVVPEDYAAAGQSVMMTGEPNTFFFEDSGYRKISGLPGVARASPQIYIATLFASCCAAPVQMVAIDPETDFTVSVWLKENPGVTLGKNDIIIGSGVIQDTGRDLQFYGHTFHVVGQLARTGMGVDNSVFVRFEDAYVMAGESRQKAASALVIPRDRVSVVLVKTDPGRSAVSVADEIRRAVPGTRTIVREGLLDAVSGQLEALTRLLYGSTVAIAVVSVPLLGVISAMVTHERRREISLLRAIGAKKSFVARIVLAETLSLAVTGSLAGIGSAAVILAGFQDFIRISLEIPFTTPSAAAMIADGGIALLLPVAIGGISTLYPLLLVTRSEPYETIRRGEP